MHWPPARTLAEAELNVVRGLGRRQGRQGRLLAQRRHRRRRPAHQYLRRTTSSPTSATSASRGATPSSTGASGRTPSAGPRIGRPGELEGPYHPGRRPQEGLSRRSRDLDETQAAIKIAQEWWRFAGEAVKKVTTPEAMKDPGPLLQAGKNFGEAQVDLVKAELAYRTAWAEFMRRLAIIRCAAVPVRRPHVAVNHLERPSVLPG